MKKVWISMTGDENCRSSAQASALDQLSKVYDEHLLGPVRWDRRWRNSRPTHHRVSHLCPAPLCKLCPTGPARTQDRGASAAAAAGHMRTGDAEPAPSVSSSAASRFRSHFLQLFPCGSGWTDF